MSSLRIGRPLAAVGALVALWSTSAAGGPYGTAEARICAIWLGISWTAEEGATERLDAFSRCTGEVTNGR